MMTLTRVRAALLYVAAWTPLALVYTFLISNSSASTAVEAMAVAVRSVGFVACLSIAVIAVGRRWPWPTPPGISFLLAHVALSLLFSGLWDLAIFADIARVEPTAVATLERMRPWIFWQTFEGLVIYGAVIGLTWAQGAAERARESAARIAHADALRATAELAALRGQLDPHFLFNTLHSVSVLVRRDPVAAEQSLQRLAALLRYVLDTKRGARDDVLLADELAFVNDYLALESIRFGTRLRVHRSVSDDALTQRVPSFALQSLVENAIKHGIAPRADGGTLTVNGRVDHGALVLEVGDDGPGATAQSMLSGAGVGLDALRKRLDARYGALAALDVTTSVGHGFQVRLRIPA